MESQSLLMKAARHRLPAANIKAVAVPVFHVGEGEITTTGRCGLNIAFRPVDGAARSLLAQGGGCNGGIIGNGLIDLFCGDRGTKCPKQNSQRDKSWNGHRSPL